MDLHIRAVTDRELDHVGALVLRAYDAVGDFGPDYRDFLADPARWVAGTTATYVAERDGRIVGVVGFVLPGDAEFEGTEPPAGDSGFRFLAVDPDAQGSGAGHALMERCIDEARRRGCRRMSIHSMAFMRAAHRLYERRGFVRRPDQDVRFPSGIGLGFALDLVPDAETHFPPPGPVPAAPPWYEDVWPQDPADQAHPIC